MRVLGYVVGDADRVTLEALLGPVIHAARRRGIGIRFIRLGGRSTLLNQVGRTAADHLNEHQDDWIFGLPDLHPMAAFEGTPNAHRSFDDLARIIRGRFLERARIVHLPDQLRAHFRIHCLKYDLEVLVLAAHEALRDRLGTEDNLGHWTKPVEEQDDQKPPKRVVEELCKKYLRREYQGTVDGPWIMAKADLDTIVERCPQRFAPFVGELRELSNGGTL